MSRDSFFSISLPKEAEPDCIELWYFLVSFVRKSWVCNIISSLMVWGCNIKLYEFDNCWHSIFWLLIKVHCIIGTDSIIRVNCLLRRKTNIIFVYASYWWFLSIKDIISGSRSYIGTDSIIRVNCLLRRKTSVIFAYALCWGIFSI